MRRVALALLLVGTVWAGEPTADARKPVDGARALRRLTEAQARVVERELLVRARDVRDGDVVVDVRSDDDFGGCRIPGALNMPLFAVKTKAALKEQSVVLVGEGLQRVVEECRRMRKLGFRGARVLVGGMAGWVQAGRVVEGDAFARRRTSSLAPGVFHGDRDLAGVEVFDVGGATMRDALPRAMAVPMMAGPRGAEAVARVVADLVARKGDEVLYVVIVADEAAVRAVEGPVTARVDVPVFFLDGGAYRGFLDGQVKMWGGAGRVVTRGCPTCR